MDSFRRLKLKPDPDETFRGITGSEFDPVSKSGPQLAAWNDEYRAGFYFGIICTATQHRANKTGCQSVAEPVQIVFFKESTNRTWP